MGCTVGMTEASSLDYAYIQCSVEMLLNIYYYYYIYSFFRMVMQRRFQMDLQVNLSALEIDCVLK